MCSPRLVSAYIIPSCLWVTYDYVDDNRKNSPYPGFSDLAMANLVAENGLSSQNTPVRTVEFLEKD